MSRIVAFIILVCITVSVSAQDSPIKIPKEELRNLKFEKLSKGTERFISAEPLRIDFGHGPAESYLFELPEYRKAGKEFIVDSRVFKGQFYYPIILILDENLELIQEVRQPIEFQQLTLSQQRFLTGDLLDENAKYLVITTDPTNFGKGVDYLVESSNSTPIYSGGTVIFVPGRTRQLLNTASISSEGKIKILLPFDFGESPQRRYQGFTFEFGIGFGGERIAENPDGDDYRAGGGAVFSAGYSKNFKGTPINWRVLGGFRYQGGQGTNQGFHFLPSLYLSTRYVNFGAGLQFDFGNSVKAPDGTKTSFTGATGLNIWLEGKLMETLGFNLFHISTEYEDSNSIVYSGSRTGFMLNFWL